MRRYGSQGRQLLFDLFDLQRSGVCESCRKYLFGRMQTQSVCPTCGGTGKVITNPCDECKGEGTIKGSEVVEIRIPAGVGDGMVLTVSGKEMRLVTAV